MTVLDCSSHLLQVDIQLPDDLAPLSFMFLGSLVGSSKSQAILKMLSIMRARSDYRLICLDRLGEILEKFVDDTTLVYNQQRRQGRNFVSC